MGDVESTGSGSMLTNNELCGKTMDWEYFDTKRIISCGSTLTGKYVTLQSQTNPFQIEDIFLHGGLQEEIDGRHTIFSKF